MPNSTFISEYWLKRPRLVRTGNLSKHMGRSRYTSHQGEREKARRLRQRG